MVSDRCWFPSTQLSTLNFYALLTLLGRFSSMFTAEFSRRNLNLIKLTQSLALGVGETRLAASASPLKSSFRLLPDSGSTGAVVWSVCFAQICMLDFYFSFSYLIDDQMVGLMSFLEQQQPLKFEI